MTRDVRLGRGRGGGRLGRDAARRRAATRRRRADAVDLGPTGGDDEQGAKREHREANKIHWFNTSPYTAAIAGPSRANRMDRTERFARWTSPSTSDEAAIRGSRRSPWRQARRRRQRAEGHRRAEERRREGASSKVDLPLPRGRPRGSEADVARPRGGGGNDEAPPRRRRPAQAHVGGRLPRPHRRRGRTSRLAGSTTMP